jgi:hypothetical protein
MVAHWLGLSQATASERSIIRGLAEFDNGHNFSNELQEYILKDRRGAYVPVNDKDVYWYITHDSNPKGNFFIIYRNIFFFGGFSKKFYYEITYLRAFQKLIILPIILHGLSKS